MSAHGEVIVLVHGLWMPGLVMLPLQRRLATLGFATRRFSYRSVRGGLNENAEALRRHVEAIDAPTIHLAGHSLGGLVILAMLSRAADPRVRRVVLMGSPCTGSHCGAVLLGVPGLAAVVGRSIRDWQSSPQPAPPSAVDIGVIAGTTGLGLGLLIPGLRQPNDGVVAVAETFLAQARDAITLPLAHSQMLVSRQCADQAAAFLRNGSFARG